MWQKRYFYGELIQSFRHPFLFSSAQHHLQTFLFLPWMFYFKPAVRISPSVSSAPCWCWRLLTVCCLNRALVVSYIHKTNLAPTWSSGDFVPILFPLSPKPLCCIDVLCISSLESLSALCPFLPQKWYEAAVLMSCSLINVRRMPLAYSSWFHCCLSQR